MNWIDIPTEQTTAVTDLFLAILGAFGYGYLAQFESRDPMKTQIWRWVLFFLLAAAFLGFVAHGFQMSPELNDVLWQPLNLFLGLAIAFFVVGVIHDVWGRRASRVASFIMTLVGILFYAVTRLIQGSFLVFILYEAVAMLFALGAYSYLAVRRHFPGAWWMAASILINITAAAIQATKLVRFTFIWEFDHNGTFHLIQMVGIILLLVGLTKSFRAVGSYVVSE